VSIVGGGVAGLATAWWLCREPGVRVTLFERDPQLATRSSALNAAILRTLDPDPETTALCERSSDFLRHPPAGFAEHPLVDPVGLVLTAAEGPAAEELAGWVAHCRPASEATALDPAELRERAPFYRGEGHRAWWFPHEGRLDVALLCDAFARGARAGGAELRTGAAGTVAALHVEGGAVRGVRLADDALVQADVVVLAAGGWAGALGRAAGSAVDLTPTRRHLVVTAPTESVDPRWPVVWRHGDAFYCRPESGGLLVCGCDQTVVDDPDRLERDPAVLETVAAKTAQNVPALADAGAAHWWCGLRTMTASGRFAVGPDPAVAGLFWVAGLGGHGMTAGPEAGRLAAALLRGREPAGAAALEPVPAG